ncbi:UNVERIFIED_CONTAM: hypothetical protein FKN15_069339 [Acipenser sinensis]
MFSVFPQRNTPYKTEKSRSRAAHIYSLCCLGTCVLITVFANRLPSTQIFLSQSYPVLADRE